MLVTSKGLTAPQGETDAAGWGAAGAAGSTSRPRTDTDTLPPGRGAETASRAPRQRGRPSPSSLSRPLGCWSRARGRRLARMLHAKPGRLSRPPSKPRAARWQGRSCPGCGDVTLPSAGSPNREGLFCKIFQRKKISNFLSTKKKKKKKKALIYMYSVLCPC